MVNKSSSTQVPSTVAGSVQKRPTLIIRSDDKRNTEEYRRNYHGEIIVLEPEAFLKYITKSSSTISDPGASADVISTAIHPPTNLYWDPADPNAIAYISGASVSEVALTVTFDPSVDDNSTDGSLTYEVVSEVIDATQAAAIIAAGGAQQTNAAGGPSVPTNAAQPGVTLSTVSVVHFTSSDINLKWKAVPGVTGYQVVITGNNIHGAAGRTTYTYHSDSSVSNGYHFFDLKPATGKSFSGSYSFAISAIYDKTTTKAVTYTNAI